MVSSAMIRSALRSICSPPAVAATSWHSTVVPRLPHLEFVRTVQPRRPSGTCQVIPRWIAELESLGARRPDRPPSRNTSNKTKHKVPESAGPSETLAPTEHIELSYDFSLEGRTTTTSWRRSSGLMGGGCHGVLGAVTAAACVLAKSGLVSSSISKMDRRSCGER